MFSATFQQLTGHAPFPWQEELWGKFLEGIENRTSLDIPTGLGKTSVIATWLIARSQGAPIPRRLVYIVDRRAVVDQATTEAMKLRARLESLPQLKSQLGFAANETLPISTLRGQHIDKREWLENPSASAVIVGTVDMIGSRLLFEGYGVSRKMRSYHAGLLGADALFVLDEAHLVPPFEMMLQEIALNSGGFGPDKDLASLIPDFKLMSLSATGRSAKGVVWQLTDADLKDLTVKRRLEAKKRLSFCESDGSLSLEELLAQEAWILTDQGRKAVRVIVFSSSREVAEKAKASLEKIAKGDKKQGIDAVPIETELFVGARRVHEREQAADWLNEYGFLADSGNSPLRPTFLFATSAGEVGVDLDADHMVCDLVAWERMVQRLGRVNRRGDGDATVRVVVESPQCDKSTNQAIETPGTVRSKAQQKKVDAYLAGCEKVEKFRRPLVALAKKNDAYDASPGAILNLKLKAEADQQLAEILHTATSEAPLRPALTRPVVDSWSMTSLEKHTGRPVVVPWLRGWVDDEPQTTVIWRRCLPVCEDSRTADNSRTAAKKQKRDATEFFEQAPPHLSEMLETESLRVFDWLTKRAKDILKKLASNSQVSGTTEDEANLRRKSVIAVVLGHSLAVQQFITLEELALEGEDKKAVKRQKESLQRSLNSSTLVVDTRFAGLSDKGLLDPTVKLEVQSSGDDADWEATGFRVRHCKDGLPSSDVEWRTCLKFPSRVSDEGEPIEWLLVEKQRAAPTSEDARAIAKASQRLHLHQEWAEKEAKRLAEAHNLPREYEKMLRIAARLHDEGKQSNRWQEAFSAPQEGRPFAKTIGPLKPRLLDGYRHEFGSLSFLVKDAEFQTLSEDLKDLALHLVAAHHGFARPVIRTSGCEDAPPSALEQRAKEIAMRFARLQHRWGPWGLAWWESLLRAADQRASRLLDEKNTAQDPKGTNG